MVKAFYKTIYRMFKNNKGRFLANLLIVLISIAISSGLASLTSIYQDSFTKNYTDYHVSDLILKETTGKGFSQIDIDKIKEDENVENASLLTCMDIESNGKIFRFYIMDFNDGINDFELIEGKYPSEKYDINSPIEVMTEKRDRCLTTYDISTEFTVETSSLGLLGINNITFEVSGVVNSPLYNSTKKENANLSSGSTDKYVDSIFYIDKKLMPSTILISGIEVNVSRLFVNTDIYITYKTKSSYFSNQYKEEMNDKKQKIELSYKDGNVVVLTLEENISYALFKNYNDKVQSIAYIFPMFFILLCALVNLITITKLIKDERAIIGTYVSLGISKIRIIFKYFLFTFFSTTNGTIVGFLLGVTLLPIVIYPAYGTVFDMKEMTIFNNLHWYGYLCALLIVLAGLIVTIFSSISYLREKPASLMKSKAPKAGKKILLQKVGFIWKSLPFKYKSALRNIFLQKKNLVLTSFSIIGATLLLFIGFALLDASNALVNDDLFGGVASSMGMISTVIILFAVSMGVVVVYSLANMNISDRERELATLKVLGYYENECSLYTFREIAIISILSSLIGLPISALIVYFVFSYLEFGSLSDVRWYSYIFTFLIIVAMTFIINILLFPKVKKINMNDSLKVLE